MGNTNGEKVKVIVEEWKNYFAAHYNPSDDPIHREDEL